MNIIKATLAFFLVIFGGGLTWMIMNNFMVDYLAQASLVANQTTGTYNATVNTVIGNVQFYWDVIIPYGIVFCAIAVGVILTQQVIGWSRRRREEFY